METYKIVTVAGDANKKISVAFRVALSVAEGFLVNYIELDMVPAKLEECSDEAHHLLQVLLSLQYLR